MVGMDPAAVSRGANQLRSHGETVAGRVQSVADLDALSAAFGEAGQEAWQAMQARLTELRGQLEAIQQGMTHNGAVLGTSADGTAAIDQQNGTAMRTAPGGDRP